MISDEAKPSAECWDSFLLSSLHRIHLALKHCSSYEACLSRFSSFNGFDYPHATKMELSVSSVLWLHELNSWGFLSEHRTN